MFHDFNPRSPWGERLDVGDNVLKPEAISIHAPRGGSDLHALSIASHAVTFQSTLPVGGATLASFLQGPRTTISIHAPRGGSDTVAMVCFNILFDFNPRSPWGERR